MWKTIGFIVLGAGAGFALGWVLCAEHNGKVAARDLLMQQECQLLEQGRGVQEAYYHQPPLVAVWELEKYCQSMERIKKFRALETENKSFALLLPDQSLTLSHSRLGKLYDQLGKSEKSQFHFDQAISCGKQANLALPKTKEDCLRILEAMDQKHSQSDQE